MANVTGNCYIFYRKLSIFPRKLHDIFISCFVVSYLARFITVSCIWFIVECVDFKLGPGNHINRVQSKGVCVIETWSKITHSPKTVKCTDFKISLGNHSKSYKILKHRHQSPVKQKVSGKHNEVCRFQEEPWKTQ